MNIRRIVPNINAKDLDLCKSFYVDFLGMDLVMDLEWMMTFASGSNPLAQISVVKSNVVHPQSALSITIEVIDVDAMYLKAQRLRYQIPYALKDEPWGVRRFFVLDPNGMTINIMSHL